MKGLPLFILLCALSRSGWACSFDDALGTWTFYESERNLEVHYANCTFVDMTATTRRITMSYPNLAMDEYNNKGTWFAMAWAGLEVTVGGRSYYATFSFKGGCKEIGNGYSRDVTARNWACFHAVRDKRPDDEERSESELELNIIESPDFPDQKFVNDIELVSKINKIQSSWTAKAYKQHTEYTVEEMFNRGGGIATAIDNPILAPVPLTEEQKERMSYFPPNFDWRDVNGVNYVSPVRNQGGCGSCYTFASTGVLEARIRIYSGNQRQDIFSTQDMVDCSPYTSGCNGGWNAMVAGRYSQDYGIVPEECYPYTGEYSGGCMRRPECKPLTYVSNYNYVGGYFGAANEENMMEDLINNGPMSVNYLILNDFYYYESGIYHHEPDTQRKDTFNPYKATSHAVSIVAYGVNATTGEKFWTVKNSWGDWFGEDGYFRIRKGTNEVNIESAPFSTFPIP